MTKIVLPCSNSGFANTNTESPGREVQYVFVANGSYKIANNQYIQPCIVVAANTPGYNYSSNTEAIPIVWVTNETGQYRVNPGADIMYVTVVANEGIGHQNLSSTYQG